MGYDGPNYVMVIAGSTDVWEYLIYNGTKTPIEVARYPLEFEIDDYVELEVSN